MMFTTIMAIGTVGTTATTTAFAEEPDCWGALTSGAATTDGKELVGQHAKDPLPEVEGNETPRQGLANALDPRDVTPRSPSHPSEVGDALAGCP